MAAIPHEMPAPADRPGIGMRAFSWTRDRLRGRPDSEHEITVNRLMFSGTIVLCLFATAQLGSADAALVLQRTYAAFAVYSIASLVLFAHILWRPQISVGRRLVGMACDFTMVSFIAGAGGLATGFFYPLYLWTVFGNGFRFGIPYLYAAMTFANLGFLVVLSVTDSWSLHPGLSVALCASLVLLPLYAAKLIRKLSEAKRQAEEANRAKGAFLAGVSHELRTPLNAIIGLGGLLHDQVRDGDSRQMVSTIVNSGRSLLRLINGILDFSRIEAGRMPVTVVQVDLHQSLRRLTTMLAVQANAKNLAFAVHIAGRTPRDVMADYNHLEQILINLVANAIKFTERGFVVMKVDGIQHHDDRVRLRFEVTDTGIGIAPEAQSKVFERFVQADASIIDRYGGTGLGLAISKQLVKLLDGTMGLHSIVGEGSTFWFEVEVTRVAQAEPAADSGVAAVLLSRDADLGSALERAGLDIAVAARLDEIASALEAQRGDCEQDPVVFVDYREASEEPEAFLEQVRELAGVSVGLVVVTEEAGISQLPMPAQCAFVTSVTRSAEPEAIRTAVALARAAGKNAAAGDEQAEGLLAAGPPLSVLIADDNRTNQMVIAKILERVGHQTTVVDDGQAAVEALQAKRFDVVLMDVNMPGMNGIEATKLYRFASLGQARVPIIALTADATADAWTRCQEAGMDGYATKPIEPKQLLKVIDDVLNRGEARQVALQASRQDTPQNTPQAVASAPSIVPSTAGSPINLDVLTELERLGGHDFVAGLVTQFSSDTDALLSALRDAAADEDVQRFRDAAHALRGSAANLGASMVFNTCLALRAITPRQLAVEGDAQVNQLIRQTEESVALLKAHVALAGNRENPRSNIRAA